MQREAFDIGRAPAPPLNAEPRPQAPRDPQGHVRGVRATSSGLIRATLGSAAAAGAILVLFWLPAEYGIDATGVGRVLGLTQMGEIKQQLYDEAEAEDAALAQQAAAPMAPAAPDPQVLERLIAIEAQVAAIAAVSGAAQAPAAPAPVAPAPAVVAPAAPLPAQDAAPAAAAGAPPPAAADGWRDEVSYTLAPGEGIEVKLVMEEGAVARYEWTANGAVLNYDTHGDGGGNSVSYQQGRGEPEDSGELTAAFTGNHGWFWRNRSDAPVTLSLRTGGAYSEMRVP